MTDLRHQAIIWSPRMTDLRHRVPNWVTRDFMILNAQNIYQKSGSFIIDLCSKEYSVILQTCNIEKQLQWDIMKKSKL